MHDHRRRRLRSIVPAFVAAVLAAACSPPPDAETPAALDARLDAPLPMAPEITAGKLDNGLAYFIRRNDEPANRAFLRLVVDAGSLLEDDDARGAAHFLEHMAFNGTERFAKRELIAFMESIGMRVGVGLNATTSFDETVYMLSVPTDAAAPLEKAFEVLEDWARGLALDPEEIAQERGVVLEEWRSGQGAGARVRERHLPILFHGSRYADRLPIGTPESISAMDRDALLSFYRKWYRPELMAVVAVGDFEPSRVEALVRKHFESLPSAAADAPAKAQYAVPTHENTLISIAADPEVATASVQLVHKLPPDEDTTLGGYRRRLVELLYHRLLTLRLQEIARRPGSPFLTAASETARPIRASRLYSLSAVADEDRIEDALAALVAESARVARFGFTETELERGKSALLREVERRHAARDDVPSFALAAALTESFLTGRPIPSVAHELALHERFLPGITLADVEAVGRSRLAAASRVVLVTAPRKDGLDLPDEAALAAVLDSAASGALDRYVDTVVDDVLIREPPQRARIAAERRRPGGLIEWDLENGVRVVLMPTDFHVDQILFRAFSPGGTSLAADAELMAARSAAAVVASGGLGDFDVPALQRALTGKLAVAVPVITDDEERVEGHASARDIQTLFELIYLRFTAPREDADAFAVVKSRARAGLQNRNSRPETVLDDAFNRLMTQDHPRARPTTVETLDEMDLDRSMAFYRDRFGDASDFVFVFVGAFEPAALRPLVEQYLAALPAAGRQESWQDRGLRVPKGVFEETVRAGVEPRSQTRIAFNGEIDMRDQMQRTSLLAISRLLQGRLSDVLREELGATYGVRVEPRMRFIPVESYSLIIEFAADPERMDELVDRVFDEIRELRRTGFSPARVADVREALLREHETSVRHNAHWLDVLTEAYARGDEAGIEHVITRPERIAALTPESIRSDLARFLDDDNTVRVTLVPQR